jgi:hypothetical protein
VPIFIPFNAKNALPSFADKYSTVKYEKAENSAIYQG